MAYIPLNNFILILNNFVLVQITTFQNKFNHSMQNVSLDNFIKGMVFILVSFLFFVNRITEL